MKPRILRNPTYAPWTPFPAAPSQCKAIYADGRRCMAHRRLCGSESDLCSTHAKLPAVEADLAYEYIDDIDDLVR